MKQLQAKVDHADTRKKVAAAAKFHESVKAEGNKHHAAVKYAESKLQDLSAGKRKREQAIARYTAKLAEIQVAVLAVFF